MDNKIIDMAMRYAVNYLMFTNVAKVGMDGKARIGYEHDGSRLDKPLFDHDLVMDMKEGRRILRLDIMAAADAVSRAVETRYLSPGMHVALILLVKDIGKKRWQSSSIRKSLNKDDPLAAAMQFLKWNKAVLNGKIVVLPHLRVRRELQARIFCTFPTP